MLSQISTCILAEYAGLTGYAAEPPPSDGHPFAVSWSRCVVGALACGGHVHISGSECKIDLLEVGGACGAACNACGISGACVCLELAELTVLGDDACGAVGCYGTGGAWRSLGALCLGVYLLQCGSTLRGSP